MKIKQDSFISQFSIPDLRILKEEIEDNGDAIIYESEHGWGTFLWGSVLWESLVEKVIRFGNIGRYVDTVLRNKGLLQNIKSPIGGDKKVLSDFSLELVPTDQDEIDAVNEINSIIRNVFRTEFSERIFDANDFNQNNDLIVDTDDGFEEVEVADVFLGNGTRRRYTPSFIPEENKVAVFVDGVQELNYRLTEDDRIFFFVAPSNGSEIKIYNLTPIDAGSFAEPYANGDPEELARYNPVENIVMDVEVNTTSVSLDPFITEVFEGFDPGAWGNFLWGSIKWDEEITSRYGVLPFDAFENTIVYFNGVEQTEGTDYEYALGGSQNRGLIIFNNIHTTDDEIIVEYYDPIPVAYKFHYGPGGNDTPYRKCISQTTELVKDLDVNDTEIQVLDASVIGLETGRVWIGNELIEFNSVENNTLRGIKRGVQGTHVPTVHKVGSDVVNADDNQIIPDSQDFWISNIGGLSASTDISGVFLRNCPWRRTQPPVKTSVKLSGGGNINVT